MMPSPPAPDVPQVSILIPALNEAGNIGELVRRCRAALERLGLAHEIIVIDGGSTDGTVEEARREGAVAIAQEERGYGGALLKGFQTARAESIITMDSDLSHEPEVIAQLWSAREGADLVIASRYVAGGAAETSILRAALSRLLNAVFGRALRIRVRDLSSGFRLYRRSALEGINFKARDFDALEEILILILNRGGRLVEVPFHYRIRKEGKSHAKLVRFGLAYARTFVAMWRLRRSGRSER